MSDAASARVRLEFDWEPIIPSGAAASCLLRLECEILKQTARSIDISTESVKRQLSKY